MTDDHWPSPSAVLELSHGVRGLCRGKLFSLSVACQWSMISTARHFSVNMFAPSRIHRRGPSLSSRIRVDRKSSPQFVKRKHGLGLESLKKLLFQSRPGRRTMGWGNGDAPMHRGCRLYPYVSVGALCCTIPDGIPCCMSSIRGGVA